MIEKFRVSRGKGAILQTVESAATTSTQALDSMKTTWISQDSKKLFQYSYFLYLVIFLALCFSMKLDFGYRVVVNGQSFGAIASQQMAKSAVFSAYDAIVAARGTDYKFEKASFHLVPVSRDKLQSEELLSNRIAAAFDGMTSAYGIVVDGKVVTALTSEADGYAALDEIETRYKNENNETHFANAVSVQQCRVQPEMIVSREDAVKVLNGTKDALLTHTVAPGETFSSIALDYGIGTQQLMNANPDIVPEYLQQGEKILVTAPQPLIAVEATEVITIRESIPYQVEERKDSSLYKGTRKTITKGVSGQKDVVYEITKVNNSVTKKTVLSETVLSNPTTAIVAVGTKAKPANAPTGVLTRPYYGTVTARFGSRGSRWATTHTGIDYAGRTGDAIKAADGGTVTYAGWNGSYGKMVKISHGNGLETWYAHMSSIYVKSGQKVAKGATIGALGSTGNTTGPHLHFEVRKNGVAKNPSNYVK